MGQSGYCYPIRQRIITIHVIIGVCIGMMLVLTACRDNNNRSDEQNTDKVLARVFEFKLYSSEIRDLVPVGTPSADSARLVDGYINSWVREMLLVNKAEKNLSPEQKNVEKQLQTYRNSLIIYNYEKALVEQQLDTIVTDSEIEAYYKQHPNDFALRDNIVKVIYVKVNKNAPNLPKLKNWVRSDRPQDRVELAGYCGQFASNYYLDDDSWLLFDDLLKEVPILTYNSQLFLQNNRDVEVSDSANTYLLHIKSYMMRDSQSPLAFEKNNIRTIILNKRKRELIDRMRDDLYREASENKNIELYTN